MWKNERAFVKYVSSRLEAEGLNVMRIESAATAPGCPDMYVMGRGMSTFIEFKNMSDKSIHDGQWRVPWRAGQLAWAMQYLFSHRIEYAGQFHDGMASWTAVGLKDGVLLIRMSVPFKDNLVLKDRHAPYIWLFGRKEFSSLDLRGFFFRHTRRLVPVICAGDTWREYLRRQAGLVIGEKFGGHFVGARVPDDDMLARVAGVDESHMGDDINVDEPEPAARMLIERSMSEKFFQDYQQVIEPCVRLS